MNRRFDPLADSCDHDAIFALSYLRTTEEYRRTIEDPDFFEDTGFVNHEDAVFAAYYFDAYDDWRHDRTTEVPPAWRIAFQAADDGEVSAAGNMFLGMNAHIQRDLPFVRKTARSYPRRKAHGEALAAQAASIGVRLDRVASPREARRLLRNLEAGSFAEAD